MANHPRKIDRFSATEMLVDWSDGRTFKLPYVELRYRCPCAACVDEHTGRRMIRRETVRSDVRPRSVAPVGRYAIQISWSDGHATGMYAFELLRSVCESAGTLLGSG